MPRTDQEGCDNMLGSNCTGREQTSMANPSQEGADAASCASHMPATGVGRQMAQGTAVGQGGCRPTNPAPHDPAERYTAMLEAGYDNCQAYRVAYLGRSTADVLREDAEAVPTPPPDPAALYTTLLENGTDRLEAWERSYGAVDRGASPTSPLAANALTGCTTANAAAGQHTDRAHLFQMLASIFTAASAQQDTTAQPPLSATACGTRPSTMEAEPLPLGTQPNGSTRTGNAHQVFLAEKKAGTVFGAPVGGAKTACAASTDDEARMDDSLMFPPEEYPPVSSYEPPPPSLPTSVDFIYGDISFSIPWTWYQQYRREGAASTVDQTLALLWAPFLSDLADCPVSRMTVKGLLGCYNVGIDGKDQDGNPYLFWNEYWGAPFEVFQYAVKMAATYHEAIADDFTTSMSCVGFGQFVYDVLQGKEAYRSSIVSHECQPRRFMVSFSSNDMAYQGENLIKPCGKEYECGQGFAGHTCGYPWNYFTIKDTVLDRHHCLVGTEGKDPTDIAEETTGIRDDKDDPVIPETGCPDKLSTAVTNYNYYSSMHPIYLAFDGYRCDYLLHFARTAMDYAFSGLLSGDLSPGEAYEYLLAASRIGRFVLHIIANWGVLLIHEIGHTYTNKGHCEEVALGCVEVARFAWQCHVRGRLGLLYKNHYYPALDGDAESAGGGLEGGEWRCDVEDYGKVGMDARYCSTVCPDKTGICALPLNASSPSTKRPGP